MLFTYLVYNLLAFLMCATCNRYSHLSPCQGVLAWAETDASALVSPSRILLQKDYGFLRDISIFPPLVTVYLCCHPLCSHEQPHWGIPHPVRSGPG